MKKNKNNSKALKSVLAGAIAFTPVLAVGINAEKASAVAVAPTAEQTAESLANGYANLLPDQKVVFDIVLANLSQYMGNFIQDSGTYPNLEDDMKALVAPYNYTTKVQLKIDLTTRFNTFTDATKNDLKDEGTVAELLTYVQNVSEDLIGKTGDVNRTNLNNFYDNLFNVLYSLNSAPQGVKDVLKVPSNPSTIISEIQSEVNAAFPSGGGGGGTTPPPTPPPVEDNGDGEVSTGGDTVEKEPQKVIDAIEKAESIEELVVTIPENAEEVAVAGTIFNALSKKNPEAVVVISTPAAAYALPVSTVNLQALAQQLNVTSAELKVEIKVQEVETPAFLDTQYEVLSPSIEFEVTVTAPNGNSVVLTVFPQPVMRSVNTSATVDASTTVGVTIVNGQVRAVPTFVVSGNKSANLYRAGNSTYTLIENFKTFKDVDNGANWSEEYIEKLASRMIVSGTTADTFSPQRSITRGEFASILARGLGLVAKNKEVPFTDVSSTQAINKNGEIAAVLEAGIISGYEDGKFRPEKEINRAEAAIMISKALEYYGKDLVTLDDDKKVASFKDYAFIGASSRPHIETVLQAGFINGYGNGTYRPSNEATRAEIARILYDFLQSIKFIN